MGGSGSTCFGSHDALRDNDQSTTGTDDANESNDGWQRTAGVLGRFECLSRSWGPGEEGFVSRSVDRERAGRGKWHYNVTEYA